MANFLFNAAYLSYSACTFLYLAYLLTKRERYSGWAANFLKAALTIHLLSVLVRFVAAPYTPWSDWFESFSLFGAIIALLYLIISRKNHIPILGAFIMPLSWGLLTGAFFSNKAARPASPALNNFWMAVHVPVMFTSYAVLAIAFAVGVVYLLQERQMKSKHPSELTYRLPPLEELDNLIFRLIQAALPLLTLGILLGGVWAYQAWGRFWGWDPKETWALLTWMMYAAYLLSRTAIGWRGRKSAYLSLAGFALVLFTYVGVNYFSPLHGFLARPPAAGGVTGTTH